MKITISSSVRLRRSRGIAFRSLFFFFFFFFWTIADNYIILGHLDLFCLTLPNVKEPYYLFRTSGKLLVWFWCMYRMKNNIVGMEANMEQLLQKVCNFHLNLVWVCALFCACIWKSKMARNNIDSQPLQIMSVQSRSDGVNTSLFEKREHIEKLHRTRNLLRKLQVPRLLACLFMIYMHSMTLANNTMARGWGNESWKSSYNVWLITIRTTMSC